MVRKKEKSDIPKLPNAPGVYKFYDKSGELLYVGKARSLKKRVASYFVKQKSLPYKVKKLVQKIDNVDYVQTKTENDALFLEDELIKHHQPAFNILMRDDKSYPFIYVSTHETFPRVVFGYRPSDFKEGTYYGPFVRSRMVKEVLMELRKTYPYRDCSLDVGHKVYAESCLYDQLGLCSAPCIGKDSVAAYQTMIRKICHVLDGKQKALIRELYGKMMDAAAQEHFEKAAHLKELWLVAKDVFQKSMFQNDAWQRYVNEGLRNLQGLLKMRHPIVTMEAYDISNTSGTDAVGVSVVFRQGRPDKKLYRTYRIKNVEGPDDCAMMREVLKRRFSPKGLAASPRPDLVVIDGGKGQLSSACQALSELGIKRGGLIALAKKFELVYTPDSTQPIILGKHSYARKVLQAIRDEAHRFAISYHRRLRKKTVKKSVLDHIPGLGSVLKRRLFEEFQSLKGIQGATEAELACVKGISAKKAKLIVQFVSHRSFK